MQPRLLATSARSAGNGPRTSIHDRAGSKPRLARARRGRSLAIAIALVAGMAAPAHASGLPVTFSYEGTVTSLTLLGGADWLGGSVTPGSAAEGIFSFFDTLISSTPTSATYAGSVPPIRVELGGFTLDAAALPQLTFDIDVLNGATVDRLLYSFATGPSLTDPFYVPQFIVDLTGGPDVIDSTELPLDPDVWNAFPSRELTTVLVGETAGGASGSYEVLIDVSVFLPEPSLGLLLASGVVCLGWTRRRTPPTAKA